MRRAIWVLALLLICQTLYGSKPKKSAAPSLSDRFSSLSCAVVHIRTDSDNGTGTFISKDGDVLTASHVVFNRWFTNDPRTLEIVTNIQAMPNIIVLTSDSEPHHVTVEPTPEDAGRAFDDIAIIKTGIQPPCYVNLGDANSAKIGDHLIAMGFPSYGDNLTLYDGFLDSRFQRGQVPIGRSGNSLVYSHDEVLRIQMPISAGVSGAALIDDADRVIGVVAELPMIFPDDLQALVQRWNLRLKLQASLPAGMPNPVLSDQELPVAELAGIFREFGSPGTALAVPVSYLDNRREPAHKP